jgi:hypothetical protein
MSKSEQVLSTSCALTCSSARKVEDPPRYRCLCCREPCDFLPVLPAFAPPWFLRADSVHSPLQKQGVQSEVLAVDRDGYLIDAQRRNTRDLAAAEAFFRSA